MFRLPWRLLTVLLVLPGLCLAEERTKVPEASPAAKPLISRIAFGSRSTQDEPLPILRTVLEWEPKIFIYFGDNIYGDARDMKLLESKYAKLAANKDSQALRGQTPIIATWDDHDYGENDYLPDTNPDKTLLGNQQWEWLEERLSSESMT